MRHKHKEREQWWWVGRALDGSTFSFIFLLINDVNIANIGSQRNVFHHHIFTHSVIMSSLLLSLTYLCLHFTSSLLPLCSPDSFPLTGSLHLWEWGGPSQRNQPILAVHVTSGLGTSSHTGARHDTQFPLIHLSLHLPSPFGVFLPPPNFFPSAFMMFRIYKMYPLTPSLSAPQLFRSPLVSQFPFYFDVPHKHMHMCIS